MRVNRSKRGGAGVVGLAVLAGVSLVGCKPTVKPCTTTWIGPAGGEFGDGANWSTGAAPSSADRACAPGGSDIVLNGAAEVDSVTFAGLLTVTAGSSLTVNRTITVSAIDRLQLDGSLGGAASMTVAELTSTTGVLGGSGDIAVGGATASVIDGVTVDGSRTLVVGPNVALSGTTQVCDAGRLQIATTATQSTPLTVTSAGCAIVDHPELSIAADAGWTVAAAVDASTVDVTTSGTLAVASGVTLRAGAVHQRGGTTTLAAASSTIDLSGTGTYHLLSGTLAGRGTIVGGLTGDAASGGGTGVVHGGSSSTGKLTVSGNVSGDGLTFDHTIAAGSPTPALNQVAVGGAVDVTGAHLTLSATGAYVPPRGLRIVPITTASATGALASLDSPAIGPKRWQQQNTAAGITLKVLPGTAGDVDNDGTADMVFLDATANRWYLGGPANPFGPPTSSLLYSVTGTLGAPSGDFDGDGTTEFASVTTGAAGAWSTSGAAGTIALPFTSAAGRAFVVSVPGDYDGNGTTDPGWYDGATATWYLAGAAPIAFGSVGTGLPAPGAPATTHRDWDYPVPADYDGDGTTDLATWNPRTNLWTMRWSSDSTIHTTTLGDVHQFNLPVPADYAGAGRAVPAMFTAGVGWRGQGMAVDPFTGVDAFGSTDADVLPAVADYNGDGRADLSYVNNLGSSSPTSPFGGPTAWKFKNGTPYPIASFAGAATRLPAAASLDLVAQVARFTLIQQDCTLRGLC